MSENDGNGQELAESGTNANNDKQQQEKKPLTAFVQIGLAPEQVYGPVKVELTVSPNCSTVAEHVAYLLEHINKSQGNVFDFQLECPVELASVLKEDTFLMNHNVPLDGDFTYTFKFRLAKGVGNGQEEDGLVPVEELAKQVAQLTEEQAKHQGQMAQLAKEKDELKEQMEGKIAQLGEEQAKQQGQMKQMEKEKETLKRKVEEQEKQGEKRRKLLEVKETRVEKLEKEQRMASAEYASLIGVPIVTSLDGNYSRLRLMQLLEHGNTTPGIYIQRDQQLNDLGLLQSIVDLLAKAEKPEKMVGEVKIESSRIFFTWPIREELKLKCKTPNVAYRYNEASANSESYPYRCLAEYELTNGECRFQVLVHYFDESRFNKAVAKFIYRRLP